MGFSLISIEQSEISETFKTINPENPCWIFAAKSNLSTTAMLELEAKLGVFSDEWSHHGNSIELGVIGINNQVFVLYTEQAIGGCSRDALLNKLQALQGEVNVEWVQTGSFGIKIEDKLIWAKVPEIKALNSEQKITPQSEVCQLHLHQIKQIQEDLLFTPALASQLKRTVK